MQHSQSIPSSPIVLSRTSEMAVYGLFAIAMAITVCGVVIGGMYASTLFSGGTHMILLIAELGIIFSSPLWKDKTPLNYLLFGLFPLLSGITIAPYLWYVSAGYANGNQILINALGATVFMAAAAALFARTTSWNLGVMGRFLFFALLGLIGMAILQIFIPSLRGNTALEMALSGIGVLVFAGFTAYDVQRIKQMSQLGANPFMLALSLYLDIFNLFLYILRFMTSLSGDR